MKVDLGRCLTETRKKRWAIVLAGGEGTRLRSLTRLVTGDETPKQFCRLVAGKTLLAHTRERIADGIPRDRTLFVLLGAQERFYADELANVPSTRMVVQPSNRGTLPAILYSLMRVMSLDPDAVVAFFPSDHYYANETNFMAGIDFAFRSAETDQEAVILLGSPATHPETDYGWIEAEAMLSPASRSGLLRVKRFWEKPALTVAQNLLDRGCVWNTFVMVGHARTFLSVILPVRARTLSDFLRSAQRPFCSRCGSVDERDLFCNSRYRPVEPSAGCVAGKVASPLFG